MVGMSTPPALVSLAPRHSAVLSHLHPPPSLRRLTCCPPLMPPSPPWGSTSSLSHFYDLSWLLYFFSVFPDDCCVLLKVKDMWQQQKRWARGTSSPRSNVGHMARNASLAEVFSNKKGWAEVVSLVEATAIMTGTSKNGRDHLHRCNNQNIDDRPEGRSGASSNGNNGDFAKW